MRQTYWKTRRKLTGNMSRNSRNTSQNSPKIAGSSPKTSPKKLTSACSSNDLTTIGPRAKHCFLLEKRECGAPYRGNVEGCEIWRLPM
ncbi:hypothetical protein Bca4012_055610 [Brassica carinata]